jgi:hypothetical protein
LFLREVKVHCRIVTSTITRRNSRTPGLRRYRVAGRLRTG